MATFTLTKSASLISVTAGTGTLDQLNTDIGDTAYMEKTGAGPYVYSIKGNKELRLASGVTLNMSTAGTTLQWSSRTAHGTFFQVLGGAAFNVTEDCIIDFETAGTYYTIINFQGSTSFQGTSGHNVILKHYYYNYIRATLGDSHDWDYVTLTDMAYSTSGYFMGFYSESTSKLIGSFTNITISSSGDANARGYAFYIFNQDLTSVILDNIHIDGTRYTFWCGGSTFKMSNSTIENVYSYGYFYGAGSGRGYYAGINDTGNTFQTNNYQPKITFDTCTFNHNYVGGGATNYCFYIPYQSVIKFKNCTWSNGLYGAVSYYNSCLLYEGSETFTSVTNEKWWSYNGSHYDCKTLVLAVKDNNGNAIENAVVTVNQASGNEISYFLTNASGEVKDLFGDNPVFVYREEYSNGNFDNWSTDYTVGLYHLINITKLGHKVWTSKVEFDADRTITATLIPIGAVKSLTTPVRS